jgi:hypothetical protein
VGLYTLAIDAAINPAPGMTERAEVIVASPLKNASEAADELRPTPGPTGNRIATTSRAQISIGQLVGLRNGPPPAPDGEPPTTPEDVSATAVSGARVDVSWTSSSDNVGVHHYSVRRAVVESGTPGPFTEVAQATTTTFADVSVTGTTTYRYVVVAVDADGNESETSDHADATTPVAIVWRGSTTAFGKGATSLTLTRPGTAVTGDMLIAVIDLRSSATVVPPGGWTEILSVQNRTALRQAAYWHVLSAGDPASYQWTWPGATVAGGSLLAYSGVDSLNPIDDSGSQLSGNSVVMTAPPITTTVSGAVVLAIFGHAADGTIAVPAGLAARAFIAVTGPSAKLSLLVADETRASPGMVAARTTTASKSAVSIGSSIALRPASDP